MSALSPFGAPAIIRALPFKTRVDLYKRAREIATAMGKGRRPLVLRFWRAVLVRRLLQAQSFEAKESAP